MAVAPEDIRPSFNVNARKYRCCFGYCCHLTDCVKLIAGFELLAASCTFASALINYVHYKQTGGRDPLLETNATTRRPLRPGSATTVAVTTHATTTAHRNDTTRPPPTNSLENLDEYVTKFVDNQEVLFSAHAFAFAVVLIVCVVLLVGVVKRRQACLLPHLFVQALSMLCLVTVTVFYMLPKGSRLSPFASRAVIGAAFGTALVYEAFCIACVLRCYLYIRDMRRALPCARPPPPASEGKDAY